ncbi:hypothetical protein RHO13_10725 [Orbus wheelerorum]|uniref:hypothetical protein n=1 Tax=Orbus wheelerorum TaxID=3074111 RepID=UPI00370D14DB
MNSSISLYRQLDSIQNQPYYRYLLLDMLGDVNELSILHPSLLKEQFAKEHIIPIARPELNYDLSSCPHLICLALPNQSINFEYIQNSYIEAMQERLFTKRYVCSWLVSELAPTEMADAILQNGINLGLLVNKPFIPFYEPFLLQLLQDDNHIQVGWLKKYLPFAKHYFYLDVSAKLRDATYQQDENLSEWVFLSDSIPFNLRENKNIFYLYAEYVDILSDEGKTADDRTLSQLLGYYQKSTKRLSNLSDCYLFTIYCMRYGDLSNNSSVLAILKRYDNNEIDNFRDALINLDENELLQNSDIGQL